MRLARPLLFAAVFVAACSRGGDKVDSGFDTRVADPAYAADGPRVLFDEGHNNSHRAGRSYRPFAELLRADGYRVEVIKQPLTREVLEPAALLVVVNASGRNERNDDPAFEESEGEALDAWVRGGGALLLVADHYPMGPAVEGLARRFGVRMSLGVVQDTLHFDPAYEPTHLVFARDGGGLPEHPVLSGRNGVERIQRVLTFTGQAVHADSPAVVFLALAPSARALSPDPVVEKRGNDVIVNVGYVDPEPVPGWGQGVAFEHGAGRVVVLGEAAMLSAQFSGYDGRPIGMNVAGYDNRQLALNIAHWLTRKI